MGPLREGEAMPTRVFVSKALGRGERHAETGFLPRPLSFFAPFFLAGNFGQREEKLFVYGGLCSLYGSNVKGK